MKKANKKGIIRKRCIMKKIKEFIKKNQKFVITICILLLGQAFMYWLLKLFQNDPIYINYHLDNKIPFIGYFVYIYNAFYPFMVISLYLLYKKDEKAYYKGAIAGVIGYLICDVIFLSIPTIMYRNVIPSTDPFTDFVIKVTFFFDNPPLNCFPSIHCLFCFQVIYSYIFSKETTKRKIVMVTCALLIIVSTLFIKQHYVYDVISAFLICLIANMLESLFEIYKRLKKAKKL